MDHRAPPPPALTNTAPPSPPRPALQGPKLADKVSDGTNAWISTCFAAGGCLIAGLIGVPLIKRQVARDWEELNKAEVIPELHGAVSGGVGGLPLARG